MDELSDEQIDLIATALARVFIQKAKQILGEQDNEHIGIAKAI